MPGTKGSTNEVKYVQDKLVEAADGMSDGLLLVLVNKGYTFVWRDTMEGSHPIAWTIFEGTPLVEQMWLTKGTYSILRRDMILHL